MEVSCADGAATSLQNLGLHNSCLWGLKHQNRNFKQLTMEQQCYGGTPPIIIGISIPWCKMTKSDGFVSKWGWVCLNPIASTRFSRKGWVTPWDVAPSRLAVENWTFVNFVNASLLQTSKEIDIQSRSWSTAATRMHSNISQKINWSPI